MTPILLVQISMSFFDQPAKWIVTVIAMLSGERSISMRPGRARKDPSLDTQDDIYYAHLYRHTSLPKNGGYSTYTSTCSEPCSLVTSTSLPAAPVRIASIISSTSIPS